MEVGAVRSRATPGASGPHRLSGPAPSPPPVGPDSPTVFVSRPLEKDHSLQSPSSDTGPVHTKATASSEPDKGTVCMHCELTSSGKSLPRGATRALDRVADVLRTIATSKLAVTARNDSNELEARVRHLQPRVTALAAEVEELHRSPETGAGA